jgi:hypothetical protein
MKGLLPIVSLAAGILILFLQWKDWPPDFTEMNVDGTGPTDLVDGDAPTLDALDALESETSKEAYATVVERPLFRPDRQPPPPEEEAVQASGAPELETSLDGMDLSAVIITPGLVSAWVKDPGSPKLRRLRIGDDFEGWSVNGILPDRVLLERQGVENALILRNYGQLAPSDPPLHGQRRPPRPPRPIGPGDQ